MRSSRNVALALLFAGVFAGMVAVSFAAMPLYHAFCQATGYGGATQRAEAAPAVISARRIELRLGEPTLVYFRAEDLSEGTVTGTAAFNVLPEEVDQYFGKIQCVCFAEQALKPGESVGRPVQFFVHPARLKDADMKGIDSITLSYTFFRAGDAEAADAVLYVPARPDANTAVTPN